VDIKEYIASGIIEGYVLGSLSDQERREVECMSAIYPEIKAKVLEAQQTFEKYAESISVTPPSHIKDQILAKIKQEEQITGIEKPATAKVIQLNKKSSNFNWSTFTAAASFLLLISVLAIYYFESRENTELKSSLAQIKKEQGNLNSLLEDKIAHLKASEELVISHSTKPVMLNGTDKSPNSVACVYYNQSKKSAVLCLENLPSPIADKQYQLWAMVDGKPIDLGVFDLENSKLGPVIPVSQENIQAFAITLEKKGGSPTPNLDQLYVIGNLQ
jgi:anti-sigma-K factor RskA